MTAKTKPKTPRRSMPRPKEYKLLDSSRSENKADEMPGGVRLAPTPADIRRALTAQLSKPGTPLTPAEADRILAANGIPPAKPPSPAPEGWLAALKSLASDTGKLSVRGVELFGTAVVAVATPLLTAAVDGLGLLIAAMTVWELWHPVEAMADRFVAWCG